jgi:hypothetical protein
MRTAGQPSQVLLRGCNTNSTVSEDEQRCAPYVYAGQSTILCHYETSGPGPRKAKPSQRTGNRIARTLSSTRFSILTLLFVLVLFLNGVAAQERVHPALQKLARKGELLFDRNPAPDSPHRRILMGRAAAASSTSAVSAAATLVEATASESASGTAAATLSAAFSAAASSTGIATAPGSKTSALPQPFDTSLGNNFTSTACPTYFTKFLADSTFQQCYPFSLLLQVSISFSKSGTTTNDANV